MADISPYAFVSLSDAQTTDGGGSGGDISITVNGTELAASQLSIGYRLNTIPTATALIPLGRNARTGEPSKINEDGVIDSIKQMAPVTIKLKGNLRDWSTESAGGGERKQWPQGEHIIFTGYVSGIAYRRTLGRVSLALNMMGRLVDLTMSSVGSANVVPGAPQDLFLPLTFEGTGGITAATPGGRFVEDLYQDMNIDFPEGLLKCIKLICEEDELQIHDETWCGAGQPSLKDNTSALQVLEGAGDWKGLITLAKPGDLSDYYSTYPLDVHTNGKKTVADWVGRQLANSIAGTNIWTVLVGSILPSFGMAIVPTATEAYVVPLLPQNRKAVKTIKPNEYVDFNLKVMSQRPLFGVGVLASYNNATIEKKSEDTKVCVGASYTVPSINGQNNEGMWMFVPAPGWLDGWTDYDPEAVGGGNSGVNQLMSEPSHDAVGVDDAKVDRSPSSEANDWNDELNKYAKLIYASNALRGREGSLVGKLRFDIAPGTTLKVDAKTGGDTNSSNTDNLAVSMVGLVAGVSITINAEQSSATTVFDLTNLRTEAENKEERMAMDNHPFFASTFEYAPLVSTLKVD